MTNERLSAEAIDARATEWVSRCDRGGWDARAQEEFEAWLASDTRCQGAFARAEGAWALLDRARALAAPGHEVETPLIERGRPRRNALLAGIAAAALVTCVSILGVQQWGAERYETKVGEIRSVPLTDGSLVAINTDSRLQVSMETATRVIQLDRGEAWFQVAKDASRPFVVEAGSVRVRAVGTAFSVRRRDGGVEVLVSEGVVNAWVDGEETGRRSLAAGSHAFLDMRQGARHVEENAAVVERTLAWRDRKIDLQGVTLARAAAEFNRYNTRKLVIADASLGEEPLVGRFDVDAVQSFAHAAAGMLHARVEEDVDQIRLVRVPR